jgi:hypothetical protein
MSSNLKGGGPKTVWPQELLSSRISPALVPSRADFSWLGLQTDEYLVPHLYMAFAVFACKSKGVLALSGGNHRLPAPMRQCRGGWGALKRVTCAGAQWLR